MGFHLPKPTLQNAEDVLKQMDIIFQNVRKNTMQAYINYKAYYDKKANASKLKKQQYVYVLQPKVDHQGSIFPSEISGGKALTLLKRPYQITIIWYENLERTQPKSFIAWDYDFSRLDNP